MSSCVKKKDPLIISMSLCFYIIHLSFYLSIYFSIILKQSSLPAGAKDDQEPEPLQEAWNFSRQIQNEEWPKLLMIRSQVLDIYRKPPVFVDV